MKSPYQPSKEAPRDYKKAQGDAFLAVFGHQHPYLNPSPAFFIQSRKVNSRKFAMGKATLASPTLPTGGYRILMPVHYLPDAILGSIDHRNPESRRLDHDDASPQQVRANGVRAKIFPR